MCLIRLNRNLLCKLLRFWRLMITMQFGFPEFKRLLFSLHYRWVSLDHCCDSVLLVASLVKVKVQSFDDKSTWLSNGQEEKLLIWIEKKKGPALFLEVIISYIKALWDNLSKWTLQVCSWKKMKTIKNAACEFDYFLFGIIQYETLSNYQENPEILLKQTSHY